MNLDMGHVLSSLAVALLSSLMTWLLVRTRTTAERRTWEAELAARDARLQDATKRESDLRAELAVVTQRASAAEVRLAALNAELETERRAASEKLLLLEQARSALEDTFKALSADALKANTQSFLDLAQRVLETTQTKAAGELDQRRQAIEALVTPVREQLDRVQAAVQAIETKREGAYEALLVQVRHLLDAQERLRTETNQLVRALRAPQTRGRWGEIQLRRVVEMAGMLEHCDFEEQTSMDSTDGRRRPDMIVHLPGGRLIVVDAKAPLEAYLGAIEAPDEVERRHYLTRHARQIRDHIAQLGEKSYWEQFQPTPDFVVLFIPGESFFSAAVQEDPSLIEFGTTQRVIPASPTTLIVLLKAIAYGWRQQSLEQNAHRIADAGRQLCDRLAIFVTHLAEAGRGLRKAVSAYNNAVGSLQSRLLPCAHRLQELEVARGARELPELSPVNLDAQLPELIEPHNHNDTPSAPSPSE